MKKNISLLLFTIILFSGCKKSMDELNVNPNSPEVANPDYLFTYSVTKGMGSYNTDVYVQYWMMMNWMMHSAVLGGLDAGKEYEENSGKNNLWAELYSQSLINAHEVIRFTKDDPSLINKTSIARIWQVYLFQQMTDLWGNIPYSQALNGLANLNYSPQYDTQESIYTALFEELKNASALLDESKTIFPGNSDPIYSGSVSKWKAFANSLRLRMALRLRYANPSKAQQEIALLQSQPMMASNADNALFPYNGEIKNPLFDVFARGESGGKIFPSKFLVDKLNATHDPRIKVFAKPTPLSLIFGIPDYAGLPNLVPAGSSTWNNYDLQQHSDFSSIGDWFLHQDVPGVLLSYSEVCFLQSEASLLGWWNGNAQQLYIDGIRASIESYHDTLITTGEMNSYLASVPAVNLQNIITQKWISFTFENSYEAFADYRRTGFPVLTNYNGSPINQSNFPNRLTYPSSEAILNSVHYQEANSSQGPDAASTKVWWDKN
ncbi:MAG: SusD/RagB family nutrient-binding outer membrane lipoprotein [Bacteroidetes bacterium]|nr:SusD/RagB family nutrient-binding outer membrane lipoprotein [Bacteroidota bacterium]